MLIKDIPWLSMALEHFPESYPHATLIYGQAGLGKARLATGMAQSILCEGDHALGEACGTCAACHLLSAGTHPDFRLVEPASAENDSADANAETVTKSKRKKTQIPVSAIRDLLDLVSRTPYRGRAKAILISPAEAMHSSAANALLKMLEEPPPQTHFLLVSHQPHRLPATIKSRCFRLPVMMPTSDLALNWLAQHIDDKRNELALAMAGYAPMAALNLLQDTEFWDAREKLMRRLGEGGDVLELAAHAEALEPNKVAELLAMWAYDLLAIQAGAVPRYHSDQAAALSRIAARVSGEALSNWHDRVLDYGRAAFHPLNRRLSLESLFAHYPGAALR